MPQSEVGSEIEKPAEKRTGKWYKLLKDTASEHEQKAIKYRRRKYVLNSVIVLLNTLTGSAMFASVDEAFGMMPSVLQWIRLATGLVAMVSTVIVALKGAFQYEKLYENHRQAALRYLSLFRKLQVDLVLQEAPLHLKDSWEHIMTNWDELEKDAPTVESSRREFKAELKNLLEKKKSNTRGNSTVHPAGPDIPAKKEIPKQWYRIIKTCYEQHLAHERKFKRRALRYNCILVACQAFAGSAIFSSMSESTLCGETCVQTLRSLAQILTMIAIAISALKATLDFDSLCQVHHECVLKYARLRRTLEQLLELQGKDIFENGKKLWSDWEHFLTEWREVEAGAPFVLGRKIRKHLEQENPAKDIYVMDEFGDISSAKNNDGAAIKDGTNKQLALEDGSLGKNGERLPISAAEGSSKATFASDESEVVKSRADSNECDVELRQETADEPEELQLQLNRKLPTSELATASAGVGEASQQKVVNYEKCAEGNSKATSRSREVETASAITGTDAAFKSLLPHSTAAPPELDIARIQLIR